MPLYSEERRQALVDERLDRQAVDIQRQEFWPFAAVFSGLHHEYAELMHR